MSFSHKKFIKSLERVDDLNLYIEKCLEEIEDYSYTYFSFVGVPKINYDEITQSVKIEFVTLDGDCSYKLPIESCSCYKNFKKYFEELFDQI